jgi:uncharacterized protein YggE
MRTVQAFRLGPVRALLFVGALAWCLSVGGSEAVVVAAAPAGGGAAPAPPESKGITVMGLGQAKGKPVLVEFTAIASGEAELASDAIVKHRDTKRRALKAIEDLKIAGLSVESKGFALNQAIDPNMQQMMMRGQTPTSTKQMVQVSEQLRIVLKDLDKLKDEDLMNTVLKVLDTARDGGLVIGAGSPTNYYQMQMMMQTGQAAGLAAFKIPDPTPLRMQAYQKAMDDARAKAKRLAELAGAKLGRIVSVQEGPATSQEANQMMAMMYGIRQQQGQPDPELSSNVYGDIPLTVNLSVQFALE